MTPIRDNLSSITQTRKGLLHILLVSGSCHSQFGNLPLLLPALQALQALCRVASGWLDLGSQSDIEKLVQRKRRKVVSGTDALFPFSLLQQTLPVAHLAHRQRDLSRGYYTRQIVRCFFRARMSTDGEKTVLRC